MNFPIGKNRLLHVLAGAALTVASGFAQAHAGLDGHTFRIDYVIDMGTGAGFQTLLGADLEGAGAAARIRLSATSAWSVSSDEDTIFLRYVGTGDFMNAGFPPFIGFRISDKYNTLEPFEAVSIANTTYVPNTAGNLIEDFVPATDLELGDQNTIYVNLWNSMYHHHAMGSMGDPYRDLIAVNVQFPHASAPIPEPGTSALALGGLVALGVASRRRRSR